MKKTCSRCSLGFFARHGNQRLCPGCKVGRPAGLRRGVTLDFGQRRCDHCGNDFSAIAVNQRFCSRRCVRLWREAEEAKYTCPEHRGRRRRLAPVVAQGRVRCARGAACKRAEFVDGELVGGYISPSERWHLGHPDGESVGGPEHESLQRGGTVASPSAAMVNLKRPRPIRLENDGALREDCWRLDRASRPRRSRDRDLR